MKLQRKEQKSQKALMFELISASFASSIFVTLLFVAFAGFIDVRRMILGQEISYSKLSKTVPLSIIPPTVFEK